MKSELKVMLQQSLYCKSAPSYKWTQGYDTMKSELSLHYNMSVPSYDEVWTQGYTTTKSEFTLQ